MSNCPGPFDMEKIKSINGNSIYRIMPVAMKQIVFTKKEIVEEAKREIEDITLGHFTEYFMGKIFEDTALSDEQKVNAMYEAGRGLNLWPENAPDEQKRTMIIRFMRYLYGN